MNLLDALAGACTSCNGYRQADGDGRLHPWPEMWRLAAEVAGSLDRRVAPDGAVGSLLVTSPAGVATVAGVLRSGRTLVSLPGPGRGSDLGTYGADLRSRCDESGVELLAVAPEMLDLAGSLGLGRPVVAFDALLGGDAGADRDGGRLVQFTSGSTARPKGIPLTTEQLGANVAAINDRAEMDGDAHCAAWLPLSHDMGLIGMTLCVWAAGANAEHTRPETFMARPLAWLEAWARTASRVTAAPNFALDVVATALARTPPRLDLSAMRMVICGGEVVRPATLRRFTEALRPYGFRDQALAPAYGMAEVGLAVSIGQPGERWGSVRVDGEAFATGRLVEVAEGGIELAGNGRPLDGYAIGAPVLEGDGATLDELTITGPSLTDGYLGGVRRTGPHRTGDLGATVGTGPLAGQVVVAGRLDDLLSVRGRNLYAIELEAALAGIAQLRPGCQVCVADVEGGYVVVTESRPGVDRTAVARDIRAVLAKASGVAPSGVTFVATGSLPKTASGKKRRSVVAAAVLGGTLDVEEQVALRPARHQEATEEVG